MALKSLRTEPEHEREGVWSLFSDADGGEFRVRLARAGGSNSAYQKALTKKAKQLGFRLGSLSIDEGRALYRELLVECCIKDWETKLGGQWFKGIDFDGHAEPSKLLAVTRENLLTVLAELPDLAEQLQQRANEQSLYRESELEEAAKN